MSAETKETGTRRRLLIAALGATLALAGCGKKGPLEPPPGSPDAVKREQQKQQSAEQTGVPSIKGSQKRPPPIRRPKDDFFLDPIL